MTRKNIPKNEVKCISIDFVLDFASQLGTPGGEGPRGHFSMFFEVPAQGVPKMVQGEPQGCPEPPQVPIVNDLWLIWGGIRSDV